jgi:hypothetical protein
MKTEAQPPPILEIEELFDKKAIEKFERETGLLKLQTFMSDKFNSVLGPFQQRYGVFTFLILFRLIDLHAE